MSRLILQRHGTVRVVAHAQEVIKMVLYGNVCFTQKLEWTVLPHPPHSTHLAPPHIPISLEPTKMPFVGKDVGVTTSLLKK